jgi:subtilisin-like proprotein convertase family protein
MRPIKVSGALLLVFLQGSWVFAVIEPTVVPQGNETYEPLYYTGVVESDIPYRNDSSWIAVASGAVAGHPRMVLSCAHLNYTKGIGWHGAGSTRWFLQWNRSGKPSNLNASGLTLSGFYRFDGYATLKELDLEEGKSSAQTFAKDYVVHYHVSQNTANGYFAPLLEAGATFLMPSKKVKASFRKKITGYPSGQYSSGDPLNYRYRMHETVPFDNKATVGSDSYLEITGVTTYGGNSGGPIWGWVNGRWAHAGVVVSGDAATMVGVVANHPIGMGLIFSALRNQFPDSPVIQNSIPVSGVGAIPDAGTLTKTFTVANMLGPLKTMYLSLVAPHQRRGDLIVTLRSQSGKTVRLTTAVSTASSSSPNLTLSSKVVSGFSGLSPNGAWTLSIKDCYRKNTGSLQSASLQITTQ